MYIGKNIFHHNLTEREKEVLQYISMGYNSHRIAKKLSISKNTVDTHRRNILKKTKLRTTSEIISRSRMEIIL